MNTVNIVLSVDDAQALLDLFNEYPMLLNSMPVLATCKTAIEVALSEAN